MSAGTERLAALGNRPGARRWCGRGGDLDAGALSQQAKSLQSVAAEGALLAQDAASGKTTSAYSGEHFAELRAAASQTATSSEAAATTSALEPKRRRLAVLATHVTAYLDRAGDASGPEDRALSRSLEAAAERIEALDRSLT